MNYKPSQKCRSRPRTRRGPIRRRLFAKLWRDRRKGAAYTGVCEQFEEGRNAVIGR